MSKTYIKKFRKKEENVSECISVRMHTCPSGINNAEIIALLLLAIIPPLFFPRSSSFYISAFPICIILPLFPKISPMYKIHIPLPSSPTGLNIFPYTRTPGRPSDSLSYVFFASSDTRPNYRPDPPARWGIHPFQIWAYGE